MASMMDASDVVGLQRRLRQRGLDWWIVGGWGVDAILGVQTRPHKDLDVLLPLHHLAEIRYLLTALGYRTTLIWPENRWLPGDGDGRATAFVLTDGDGREVDVHVVEATGGSAMPLWQTEGRVTAEELTWPGRIGSEPVACMSPEAQLRCHLGYALPAAHQADVARLEAFIRGPTSEASRRTDERAQSRGAARDGDP